MSGIHPSAQVDPAATVGAGCEIGPFCTVGPDVVLGDGVELKSHVVVSGATEIGAETTVFPFAALGEIPQDMKYAGESTRLEIGERNRIREHVTMHPGTAGGGGVTRVGDDGLFMAGSHVAHDAQVGDRVIVANQSALAGHVTVEDDVIVGGLSGVHQHVRVGRGAIIGAVTMVAQDVIPYSLVQAPRGRIEGLNLVGLRRRGVPREDIAALKAAFEELATGQGTFVERARRIGDEAENERVREIAKFVLASGDRNFLVPRQGDPATQGS